MLERCGDGLSFKLLLAVLFRMEEVVPTPVSCTFDFSVVLRRNTDLEVGVWVRRG